MCIFVVNIMIALVLERASFYNLGSWSVIGRLRRSAMPFKKGNINPRAVRMAAAGRLLCDTEISARVCSSDDVLTIRSWCMRSCTRLTTSPSRC